MLISYGSMSNIIDVIIPLSQSYIALYGNDLEPPMSLSTSITVPSAHRGLQDHRRYEFTETGSSKDYLSKSNLHHM